MKDCIISTWFGGNPVVRMLALIYEVLFGRPITCMLMYGLASVFSKESVITTGKMVKESLLKMQSEKGETLL